MSVARDLKSLPQGLANVFPVALFTASRTGAFVWMNAACRALLGFQDGSAPDAGFSDCMGAEDWAKLSARLTNSNPGLAHRLSEETTFKQPDGAHRSLCWQIAPADIGHGETGFAGSVSVAGAATGVAGDPSPDSGAAVLYRSRLKGRTAVDLALAAMASVSANVAHLLGYEREEILGADGFWAEKLHEDDLDTYSDALVKLLREGRSIAEYRLKDASGGYRWLRDDMRLYRLDDGRGVDIAGTWLDVTERKEAELAAKAAEEEARAASRAKSEFLAMMSHEIRTPMNGVLGMIDVLEGSGLDGRQRGCVEVARDSAHTLLRIIDDILDFSKLDTGHLHLEAIPFDLRKTVDAAVALVRPSAEKKGLTFSVEYDADAPAFLNGDPIRIRQILLNLLSNAVKFTENGSVDLTVTTRAEEDGRVTLRCAVRDTGIGIALAAQNRLFERFAQADRSIPRQYGGTGLGLAISKQLCDLMGGSIGVSSTDGAGSTFWFEVPLFVPATGAPAKDGAEVKKRQAPARPLSVLVAEDNAVNQQVIAAILGQLGHSFEVAANGRDAVEMVRSGRFDLVLMDIQMPVVDGATAAKIIRLLPGDAGRIPMVALTANAMSGDRDRYLGLGFDGYVSKPIDIAHLARLLANCGKDPQTSETPAVEALSASTG